MINALYLAPYPQSDTTTQKWRISIKTSGFESIFSSLMITKINTVDLPPITATSNYMTIFHAGTNIGTGLGIFLKYSNSEYQIGVRYIVKNGSSWQEVPGSFTPLSSWGDISIDSFMIMLSYNIVSKTTPNLTFNLVNFSTITPKTSPDFNINYTFSETEITNGSQWGFGSPPQSNTSQYGLITTNGYNSYVSSGIYLTYLQAWISYLPSTSSSASTYAMFNGTSSSYSIYSIMRSNSFVSSATAADLSFQLSIPNNLLSDVSDVLSTSTAVTLTSGTTSFAVLPSFGINGVTTGTTYITAVENAINCILKGTKILTQCGYKLVEDLVEDDNLITSDSRIIKIIRIKHSYVIPNQETNPFLIKKGEYSAIEDLYISKGHAIFHCDEFIYPNELGIIQIKNKDNTPYSYYHIETEDYLKDTIVANGVILETYTEIFEYQFINLSDEYKNKNCRRVILS